MSGDYVCIINKNHRSSFGAPVTPPPQCCGKTMALEGSAAQPETAAQACPQEAPTAEASRPQRQRKEARRK